MNSSIIDPVKTFETYYQVYKAAEESTGESLRLYYNIAGHKIEICTPNTALHPYFNPSLEHLNSNSNAQPSLTIYAWDSASTGVLMPSPPWTQTEFNARGEVDGFYDENIFLSFHLESRSLYLLDTARNIALFWMRDANEYPPHLQAVPFRPIFHWWMRENGLLFIHAAAAGMDGKAALIVGKGGSGKSSSALACITAGLQYLGDDHVLIEAKPGPQVYSIYSAARMDTYLLRILNEKSSDYQNIHLGEEDKAIVFLNQLYPNRLPQVLSLKTVLVPRIIEEKNSSINPISPMNAIKALAPSTIFMLPGAGKHDLELIAKTVAQVPCYSLNIGLNLWDVPEIIHGILS